MATTDGEIFSEQQSWPFLLVFGVPLAVGGLYWLTQLVLGPGSSSFGLPFSLIPWFIASAFSGIGCWLLARGLAAWRQVRRWGQTPLLPDPERGNIGGDVGGRVQFRGRVPAGPLEVRLECLETRTTRRAPGSDNRSRSTTRVVFQREGLAAVEDGEAAFRFAVPDVPKTGAQNVDVSYRWRVHLSTPDRDLQRSWMLFAVDGDARSTITVDSASEVSALRRSEAQAALAQATGAFVAVPGAPGWSMRSEGDALEFRVGMFRHLPLAAFLIVFAAMVGFMVTFGAAPDALATWQWIVLGLTACPLFLFALALPLTGRRNRIDRGGLKAVMTVAGVPVRSHILERSEIRALEARLRGQHSMRLQALHAVQAKRLGGLPIVVAGGLHGAQQAEALCDAIAARLGY